MEKNFEIDFGGKPLKVEKKLAPQANAALTLTYGETVVLVTAVIDKNAREGANFLPLTVEYEEKLYAAGRIKGSRFIKREGRASEEAILTGRLIDRIIRPRFDKRIRNSIQVVATVLSFDGVNDPDIPATVGASLVLSSSDIPWRGPLSATRIAKINEDFIINPSYEEREKCDFELTMASDGELINMIEFGAKSAKNEDILRAVSVAKEALKKNIKDQVKIIKEIGKKKKEINLFELDSKTTKTAESFLNKNLPSVLEPKNKIEFKSGIDDLRERFIAEFEKEIEESKEQAKLKDALDLYFESAVDDLVHKNIIDKDQRPDGRKMDEIRQLNCEVGILPRTHGSGLFARGLTHVLSAITLASPGEEQLLDNMETKGSKGFMHHYNFPPFSVGEVGFFRGPGRREIGHGALAEKALNPVIPVKDKFPYTIRIVSEVLSSNGSSSMASTCASTLALLDAGVPITNPVAGIAMGLMSIKDKYKILTDIQGPEDHYGDMDLKVAGTEKGVTAMQMDVKIEGISDKILGEALNKAEEARKQILKNIENTIKEPRKELSRYAPKIVALRVDPSKIGDIIGGGGRTINAIIEKTDTAIDINDDGQVYISGETKDNVEKAIKIIEQIIKEYEVGEKVEGTISRILDFGAFARLDDNHEGLIHISKLANYHVDNVKDIVQEGDNVKVEVIEIDELGRINLRLLENFSRKPKQSSHSPGQDRGRDMRERKFHRGGNRRPKRRY